MSLPKKVRKKNVNEQFTYTFLGSGTFRFHSWIDYNVYNFERRIIWHDT